MADEAAVSGVFAEIGAKTLAEVVAGFYRRVATDDLLSPMYPPDDMTAAEYRLLSFLTFRFGGPNNYVPERGHPRLRMRHAPFRINVAARDRWMSHMSAAIEEAHVPDATAQVMREFLGDVASFLINVVELQ